MTGKQKTLALAAAAAAAWLAWGPTGNGAWTGFMARSAVGNLADQAKQAVLSKATPGVPQLPSVPALPPVSANDSPADLIDKAFQVGNAVAKTADDVAQGAIRLSPSDRREIGRKMHAQVMASNAVWNNPAAKARIDRLAAPLLARRQATRDLTFTITLVDSPVVNAFAHEGGYLYLYRGLIEAAKSDRQLQFVIAHELAHVELGHVSRGVAMSKAAGGALGDASVVADAAYGLISRGYSKDLEFEADAWGYRTGRGAGVDRSDAVGLLEVVGAANGGPKTASTGGYATGQQTALDALLRNMDNHFRTHPPTPERIERIRRMNP